MLLKALGALRGVLGALRSVLLAVRMRRRDAFEEYPDAIEDEDEDEDDIFDDIEDVEQFDYPSETHRCGVCYAQILLLHGLGQWASGCSRCLLGFRGHPFSMSGVAAQAAAVSLRAAEGGRFKGGLNRYVT